MPVYNGIKLVLIRNALMKRPTDTVESSGGNTPQRYYGRWLIIALLALASGFGISQLRASIEREKPKFIPNPIQPTTSFNNTTTDRGNNPKPLAPGARMPANHPPVQNQAMSQTLPPSLNMSSGNLGSGTASSGAGSLPDMAEKLQNRLNTQTPNDASGWWLLGQTRLQLQQNPQAIAAFEHAITLDNSSRNQLGLAQALRAEGKQDQQQHVNQLVLSVLATEPQHPQALRLAGELAAERGDTQQALDIWQRLYPTLASTPQRQQELANLIEQTAQQAGLPSPLATQNLQTTTEQPANNTPATETAPHITLTVHIDPELAKQVQPDDTLFIYAKAMNGPAFPLAAARYRVADLPLTLTLSEQQRVVPAAGLSDYPEWKVGARISRQGDAMPAKGDLLDEIPNINRHSPTVDLWIRHSL
jgi:tetratricopeptide (TPR) repeat protein